MEKNLKDAKELSITDIYNRLSTNEQGLTTQEAVNRLQKYGPNEIPEKKKSTLLKFLSNFWGPIPWMIEIAAILSIIIEEWDDFVIIIAMILVK